MRKVFLPGVAMALAWVLPLFAGSAGDDTMNVNSRYTIERVSVSGWKTSLISNPLRAELDQAVGQKLDHPMLESLANRIKRELHVSDVAIHVLKGTTPGHVIVNFEIAREREQRFDLKIAKFLYNSRLGWSGEGSATTRFAGNAFTFGLVSDNDALPERFSGIRTRFERENLGTDRLGFHFEFDSFHNQWNNATLAYAQAAAESTASQPGEEIQIYRSRQVFEPGLTIVITPQINLDAGIRFARFRPSTPGASTESSNAVVSTLRYHQRWGSDGAQPQEVEASYSIEASTQALGSDAAYTRHAVQARYKIRHERSSIEVRFLAGLIHGPAPLFDRFVLGNASTLRGWSKFDLDPLGASHVVHGSVNYAYRFFQVFYDTGAAWDRPQDREQRQSVGAGLKKDAFQIAVAFPLRTGRMDPIFFAGMNF